MINSCKSRSIVVCVAALFLCCFSACLQNEKPGTQIKPVSLSGKDTLFEQKAVSRVFDTLELCYIGNACDCPQWLDKCLYPNDSISVAAVVGIYLEPSSKDIKIDDELKLTANKFRVKGYFRTSYGLPDTEEFLTDHPPLGKVFVYYQWEIIKPYIRYVNGERITFQ